MREELLMVSLFHLVFLGEFAIFIFYIKYRFQKKANCGSLKYLCSEISQITVVFKRPEISSLEFMHGSVHKNICLIFVSRNLNVLLCFGLIIKSGLLKSVNEYVESE